MPRKASVPLEQKVVTAGEAADLLGVSPRMIRKLVEMGYVERPARGAYPVMAMMRGYIRHLTDKRDAAIAAKEPENELAAAKAREIWLKVRRQEASVVDVEDVEAVVARIRKTFASEFAGIFADLPLDTRVRAEAGVAGALSRFDQGTNRAIADLKAGRDPLADASPAID